MQEHLLNSCLVAQQQWEEIKNLFGKTNRDPQDIKQTIFQWGKGQFSSPVVRRAWSLAMGFNIWLIWKERNQRIFQDKINPPEMIWKRTQKFIRETILAEAWEQEDWKTTPEEGRILTSLNLEQGMVCPQKQKNQSIHNQSPTEFKCPHEDFIKLNFDGASKGNPGLAGFRGIFKYSRGWTRWVYADRGGIMSNNGAELMAVYQGIRITIRNGYTKLEIKGDSNLVIEILRKLNNGKDWE